MCLRPLGFYRVLKLLGMDPGLEFKVAMAEAQAQGAKLVYGDANVQETLKKLSASIKLQARHMQKPLTETWNAHAVCLCLPALVCALSCCRDTFLMHTCQMMSRCHM